MGLGHHILSPDRAFVHYIYSCFWSLLSKGDCPALWPFPKKILGRSSSHVALIEMIGGGGVVSSLCLTQAYLPGAKQEEKKKQSFASFQRGSGLLAICPQLESEDT